MTVKKLFSYTPVIFLSIGTLLVFLPDSSQSQIHDHSFHSLIASLVVVVLLFFSLRNKLSLTNKFHKLALATLCLFTFLHVMPFTQAFAYHHQSHSPIEHPCCTHQATTTPNLITLIVKETQLLRIVEIQPLSIYSLQPQSTYNKSPPYFV